SSRRGGRSDRTACAGDGGTRTHRHLRHSHRHHSHRRVAGVAGAPVRVRRAAKARRGAGPARRPVRESRSVAAPLGRRRTSPGNSDISLPFRATCPAPAGLAHTTDRRVVLAYSQYHWGERTRPLTRRGSSDRVSPLFVRGRKFLTVFPAAR